MAAAFEWILFLVHDRCMPLYLDTILLLVDSYNFFPAALFCFILAASNHFLSIVCQLCLLRGVFKVEACMKTQFGVFSGRITHHFLHLHSFDIAFIITNTYIADYNFAKETQHIE